MMWVYDFLAVSAETEQNNIERDDITPPTTQSRIEHDVSQFACSCDNSYDDKVNAFNGR